MITENDSSNNDSDNDIITTDKNEAQNIHT